MTQLVAAKKQAETLTEQQVIDLIRGGQQGRSVRVYAATLGITAGYLQDIYAGKRSPGEKALKCFGIRKTRRIIFEYQR